MTIGRESWVPVSEAVSREESIEPFSGQGNREEYGSPVSEPSRFDFSPMPFDE